MAVGDLLASGTISGKAPRSQGSLLEMTQNGKTPILLENGETRFFVGDGDIINIRGWCDSDGGTLVGFGDCQGLIMPAVYN